MSPAVTGPMPSIVSSCSTDRAAEADRAFFGGRAAATRRARRRALGHEDLLAVGEPCRQVDRFQRRVAAGAAGPGDRVGDAGAGRQPVDAGAPHRAGHVDDDVGAAALEAEARRPVGPRRHPAADPPPAA